MSMLRRLASVLAAASGLAFVACGGGASSGASTQNAFVSTDGDAVVEDGREGIPRAGAPEGSAARVEIERRRGLDAGERFRVEVAGLTDGVIAAIWVEDPTAPGTYVHVGDVEIGNDGTGAFELSTADGDAMPADAASVSDLVGMGIALRTPSGNVLFAGVIPEFR